MNKSAAPAESTDEIVWMIFVGDRKDLRSAENRGNLHSFSTSGLTKKKAEDCYTLERFASRPDEIHTAYYYHYKRNTLGLKEETKWS